MRGELFLLLGIIAGAAAQRYAGLSFGLPYFHHWDEANITDSVRSMLSKHDDVPLHFLYGEPLMRLTKAVYVAAQKLPLAGFDTARLDDDVYTRLAGRFVNATMGASGALAVYAASRLVFRRGHAALLGALLYATCDDLVIHARYCVTDASVAGMTAWVLYACASYAARPTILRGLLACALAGVTAGFKVTGFATLVLVAPVLCLVPAAGFVRVRQPGGRAPFLDVASRALPFLAVPLAVFVFLRLNPHLLENWRVSFADFEWIASRNKSDAGKPYVWRHPGWDQVSSALYYVALQADGPPLWLTILTWTFPAAIGVAAGLRRGRLMVLVGHLHALAVVVANSSSTAYFVRYFLPALPVLAMCAGAGADLGFQAIAQRAKARPRWQRSAGALVPLAFCSLVVVPAAYRAAMAHALVLDPRIAAVEDVVRIAAAEKTSVTVGLSATVAVHENTMASYRDMHKYLERPGIVYVGDMRSAADVARARPRFVINASYRDWGKVEPFTFPWEDQWLFTDVPGYRVVRTYPMNDYVQRLDIQPDWNARITAVLLERESTELAPHLSAKAQPR